MGANLFEWFVIILAAELTAEAIIVTAKTLYNKRKPTKKTKKVIKRKTKKEAKVLKIVKDEKVG